jgi:hypothetical protein
MKYGWVNTAKNACEKAFVLTLFYKTDIQTRSSSRGFLHGQN